jgi:hypothetical protein
MKILLTLFIVSVLICSGSYAQDFDKYWSPVQLSIFGPIAFPPFGNIYGLEINPIYGSVNNMSGLNSGLCQNVNNKMSGLQVGIIFNSAKELLGAQTAFVNYSGDVSPFSFQCGIVDVTSRNDGFQIGCINISNNYSNCQLGIWNSTANTGALQCGIINFSNEELDGLQIGLINIGPSRFFPIINW